MRIAYAGIDLLCSALRTLLEDGHEVVKIFSCRTDNVYEFNTEVLHLAYERNIPVSLDRITEADLAELKKEKCSVLICGGYYYRMPIDPELPMLNIHPALLPLGRGAWPMPVTILRGLPVSGVTIHKMAASFDTGDILMQRSFDVSSEEDLVTFMEKVNALLPEMIRELCGDFDGWLSRAVPQGRGEYWQAPEERAYVLTEKNSVSEADRVLRAFRGFACIYKSGGKTWLLLDARAHPGCGDVKSLPLLDGYITAVSVQEE